MPDVTCPDCTTTHYIGPAAIGSEMTCPTCDYVFTASADSSNLAVPDDEGRSGRRINPATMAGLITGACVLLLATCFGIASLWQGKSGEQGGRGFWKGRRPAAEKPQEPPTIAQNTPSDTDKKKEKPQERPQEKKQEQPQQERPKQEQPQQERPKQENQERPRPKVDPEPGWAEDEDHFDKNDYASVAKWISILTEEPYRLYNNANKIPYENAVKKMRANLSKHIEGQTVVWEIPAQEITSSHITFNPNFMSITGPDVKKCLEVCLSGGRFQGVKGGRFQDIKGTVIGGLESGFLTGPFFRVAVPKDHPLLEKVKAGDRIKVALKIDSVRFIRVSGGLSAEGQPDPTAPRETHRAGVSRVVRISVTNVSVPQFEK